MFNRKNAKISAKSKLKSHYGIFVIACLIAAFLGVAYGDSLSALQAFSSSNIESSDTDNIRTSVGGNFDAVLNSLLDGNFDDAESISNSSSNSENTNFLGVEVGYKRGALAFIVKSVSSGSFLVTIYSAIARIIGSQDITYIIFVLLVLAMMLFVWMFFINTYKVVYRRIFLEGKTYDKVPMQRFMFLFRAKRLTKAALTMLLTSLFSFLWSLTIIGGIIKRYSYYLVPYIVAENPDISPLEAINLSRKLMNGHKWECFVLELSFIGWDILSFLTLGLLTIFFVAPYKEAAYSEYFAYIRQLGIMKKLENTDKLNDVYLYKKASEKTIKEAYSDVDELMDKPLPTLKKRKGVWRFLSDVFGIIPANDESEQNYVEYKEQILKMNSYKMYLEGKIYPNRLFTIPEKEKNSRLAQLHYTRHYSICSLILIFFTICIFGFIWEVSLNLIIEGSFAKKGMLNGPWLPIYGSGSIIILTVLNKFRSKPALEFTAAVVLCGTVEYLTSCVLEATHSGTMWWDYSGYFLNLHGRICAEGLLIFGLGGMAIVYFVAPALDNLISKIPFKVVVPVCIALSMLFCADVAYSSVHPNTGKGVTDYNTGSTDNKEASQAVTQTSASDINNIYYSI